jgi:hypothetical protein
MAPMKNDFLVSFQAALENFGVIFAVAMVVASPVLGLFGKRLHDLEIRSRFITAGILLSFSGIPAVMLPQLVADRNYQQSGLWQGAFCRLKVNCRLEGEHAGRALLDQPAERRGPRACVLIGRMLSSIQTIGPAPGHRFHFHQPRHSPKR